MAKRKRRTRKSNRRLSGLAGISAPKDMKNDLLDIAAVAVGTIVGVKGAGMLDKMINKSGTKMPGMIAPGIATVAGAAGAVLIGERVAKSPAKGVAVGGAFKPVGKVINNDNLLSGTDDQPLMMPGIGSFGQAALPELSQYSEIPEAEVTTTGGDPRYYMGTPSEVLSGDDDMIAY